MRIIADPSVAPRQPIVMRMAWKPGLSPTIPLASDPCHPNIVKNDTGTRRANATTARLDFGTGPQ
jgi:hypothetical protein